MNRHATNEEMKRRRGKKSHELLDERILTHLESRNQAQFDEWAKKYPKEFMALAINRMPKVQPIDQDLQKNVISLRTLLEELPDTDKLYSELKKAKGQRNKVLNELDAVKDDRDNMRRRIIQLQKKLKEK